MDAKLKPKAMTNEQLDDVAGGTSEQFAVVSGGDTRKSCRESLNGKKDHRESHEVSYWSWDCNV